MQWIIANMWMALAAATVLGLLFGFSFRGLLSSDSVRRARVEREIAKTELTQAKAEIDALYGAQRKRKEEDAQSVGVDESLRAELSDRETRISSLGDELSAARAELEALKSEKDNHTNVLQNVGAAATGAVAGAVLSDDNQKELTELKDRNAWLEERVTALEADVSAAHAETADDVAIPVMADVQTDGADHEKLTWRSAYLSQRVDALERKIIAGSAAAAVLAPMPTPEIAAVVPEPAPEPAPIVDNAEKAAADEELARLRWRNRYLEGRLAYFEESVEDEVETVVEADDTVETPADPEPEPEAVAASEQGSEPGSEPDSEPDSEADSAADPDPDPASETEEAPVAAPEVKPDIHPSEAMLAELEGVQPEQIDKPSEGGDDLTVITGIGPRIAEVLNGLGIWHYTQIAGWLPEHETWIENHLSFKGRVSRENWVGQAKQLVSAA
ncbi:MAG: hypothetical protein AAFZ74_16015 [Pseudomonadota bacterium]